MKKSLLLAAAGVALMLTACDERGRMNPELPSGQAQEITFNAPRVSVFTKSEDSALATDQSFTIFGKKYTGDYTTWGAATDYMFLTDNSGETSVKTGVPVNYVEAGTSTPAHWASDPTFYWPKDGSKLAFLAYSPNGINNPANWTNENNPAPEACTINFAEEGLQILGFRNEYQDDLLYCDPVIDQTVVPLPVGTQPVEMNFRHALSSLSITAVVTDDSPEYQTRINWLSIIDIYQSSDFHQNLPTQTNNASDLSPVWSNLSDLDNAFYSFTGPSGTVPSPITTSSSSLVSDYLLIPQEFIIDDNSSKITIAIEITKNGSTKPIYKTIEFKDIFPEEETTGFEIGKKYVINLEIDPVFENITVQPYAIWNWDPVDVPVVI